MMENGDKAIQFGKLSLDRKIHYKGAAYGWRADLEMKSWSVGRCEVCKGHLSREEIGEYLDTTRYSGYAHERCRHRAVKEARELCGEYIDTDQGYSFYKLLNPEEKMWNEVGPSPTQFCITAVPRK
tara:strand:- start:20504 stop:20881 length:378 start_codon:yes stop_codon:yes gene_type:complete